MISFSCFNFIKFQAIPNDQLFLVGTKIDGKEKKPRKGTTLDGPGIHIMFPPPPCGWVGGVLPSAAMYRYNYMFLLIYV